MPLHAVFPPPMVKIIPRRRLCPPSWLGMAGYHTSSTKKEICFLAARDKTPQAHAPALFGDRAIAPFAPVARHPEGNAIPHGNWRVWELLHLPMN